MSKNLKRLQDRAAAVAARIKELADVETRSEDQTAELRKLSDEADTVKGDLQFEQSLVAKEAELRTVVERAAPKSQDASGAEKATQDGKSQERLEIRALTPHHTSLKAFNESREDVESAYKVGRWLRGVIHRNADDIRWCADHGVETRGLSEGVNSAGGTLVPEILADRVIRLVEQFGTFPPAVENMTMSRDTLVIPKRLTGTSAYFVGETGVINESEPTYGNVQLIARKLAVSCRLSTEVVEDALINMADAVTVEFATSLALKIDQCGWLGTGTSDYGGLYGITTKINNGSYGASVVTAAAGGTSFGALTLADFLNVMGKLPLYARQGAAWYMSPAEG